MPKFLPDLFLIGYSLACIGVGLLGVFTADRELVQLFGLTPAVLAGADGASLLNQHRFLKAVEAAFGVFSLSYRRDILAGGQAAVVFLAGCGLAVFARLWSWRMDGRPWTAFLVLIALESLTFLLVWRESRSGRDQLK